MNTSVAATFVLIVLARITDMTMDTIRTASIVQGRRGFAAALGFVQALIYIVAIAKVLLNMDHPIYALAYALGFAIGTYLGIAIEQRLAFGLQMAALFTSKGPELAKALVSAGYRLAAVHSHARNGDMTILYVEVLRKHAQKLIHDARAIDETCFYVLNDLRAAGYVDRSLSPKTNWLGRKVSPTVSN
jgi:uncharacterized protein YebE (UPF0316 family)